MAYTEYAVEMNDIGAGRFKRQIDVFPTYEEAVEFAESDYALSLVLDGEYLNIIYIDYDDNGDEVDWGSM